MRDIETLIADAEHEAARSCGLSDVLYETRVQAAFAAILADTPEATRAEVLDALCARGFRPDAAPDVAGDGCPTTGIDPDCCPCGRHE